MASPRSSADPLASSTASPLTKRFAGLLELLTAAVVLGGPVFYVLGRVYAESYWQALGVSPSVMAVAAEDYIYRGFVVVASGLAMALPNDDSVFLWAAPLASVLLIFLSAGLIWIFHRFKRWLVSRTRRHRLRIRSLLTKGKPAWEAVDRAASALSGVSALALALLLLSSALLIPVVIATQVGKARAATVRADLEDSTSPYVTVSVDGTTTGQLVECTDRFCVLYKAGRLWPVPLDSVEWDAERYPANYINKKKG